jgi:CheY-like chemotaxis protein
MPKRSRPIILLAEDSDDDAFFFRWTLQKSDLECHLVRAEDGAQAIKVLEVAVDADGQRRSDCPDLVFLDLKMPSVSGFEVLEWIQAHPFTPPLEVVVLSGSEHANDLDRALALGASGYYVKPLSPAQLRARFSAWRERTSGSSETPGPAEASTCSPQ